MARLLCLSVINTERGHLTPVPVTGRSQLERDWALCRDLAAHFRVSCPEHRKMTYSHMYWDLPGTTPRQMSLRCLKWLVFCDRAVNAASPPNGDIDTISSVLSL